MVLTEDPVLETVIDVVVTRLNPRRLILFGSRARGEERPGSDYDLPIIEDERSPDRRGQLGRLSRALFDRLTAPVDLLLHSPAEYDQWRYSYCHVLGLAAHQGRVVYERP